MKVGESYVPMNFRGKNVSVHVSVYGANSKKQLLCLHGFGSNGKESFGPVAKYLSKKYQLVAIDWIGFGQTTKLLRKKDTYNAKYFSDFMQKFVESAIRKKILKERFIIFAVSMSGLMTGLTYNRLEKHIEKIIFLNPAGFDKEVSAKFAVIMSNPLLNKEKFLKLISTDLLWTKFLGLQKNQKKELFDRYNNGEFDVYVRATRSSMSMTGTVRATHLYHKFHLIRVPVLMIASHRDTLITEQEYLKKASKYGWKISVIDHYDHILIDQKPKEVAKAVKEFLG